MMEASILNKPHLQIMLLTAMSLLSSLATADTTLTLNGTLITDQNDDPLAFTSASISVADGILTLQSAADLFCSPTPPFDPADDDTLALVVDNNDPVEISAGPDSSTIFRAVDDTELTLVTTDPAFACLSDTIFLDGFED